MLNAVTITDSKTMVSIRSYLNLIEASTTNNITTLGNPATKMHKELETNDTSAIDHGLSVFI